MFISSFFRCIFKGGSRNFWCGEGMGERKRGHWLLKLFHRYTFLPLLSYIPFLESKGKGEQLSNGNRLKRKFSALHRTQGRWRKTEHSIMKQHHQCGCRKRCKFEVLKQFTTQRNMILTYKIHLLRCYHHDEGI